MNDCFFVSGIDARACVDLTVGTFQFFSGLILTVVTAWNVKLTKDMAKEMRNTSQISNRPYLSIHDPWGIMVARDQNEMEYLVVNVTNLGNAPANYVVHKAEAFQVSEGGGDEVVIKLDDTTHTKSECVFPKTSKIRRIQLARNLVIRSDFKDKSIKVKLRATYLGAKAVDKNSYYTSITLMIPCMPSVDVLNSSFMPVSILEEEEGLQEDGDA